MVKGEWSSSARATGGFGILLLRLGIYGGSILFLRNLRAGSFLIVNCRLVADFRQAQDRLVVWM